MKSDILTPPVEGTDSPQLGNELPVAMTACEDTSGGAVPLPSSKLSNQSPWRVEWARKEDEADLLALFFRAFGHEMPLDQWRWKYSGVEHSGSLVRKNGKVIAFYGGMPRPVSFFGQQGTAVQIGDVMVDPALGRIMMKQGPFFMAASAYLERFIGPNKDYCQGFGFPSFRVNRLAERQGLYAKVGEVQEASWEPSRHRPSFVLKVRPLCVGQMAQVDSLWIKMAADCMDFILPVRNGAHIRHRFLEHPSIVYLPFLVRCRLSGKPYGLLVLRDHGDAGVELLDMVGALSHLPSLVRIARQVTGVLGRHRLFAWLTEPVIKALAATEPNLATTEIVIPASVWKIPSDVSRIRGRWWLMGGDADFR